MSFLKFWGKKSKREGEDSKRGERRDGDESNQDAADQEKRKLKHSLSISRSGRFKQKKRERSGVLDKPELFEGPPDQAQFNSSSQNSHSRSPQVNCRETHSQIPGRLRMGQSVVS